MHRRTNHLAVHQYLPQLAEGDESHSASILLEWWISLARSHVDLLIRTRSVCQPHPSLLMNELLTRSSNTTDRSRFDSVNSDMLEPRQREMYIRKMNIQIVSEGLQTGLWVSILYSEVPA